MDDPSFPDQLVGKQIGRYFPAFRLREEHSSIPLCDALKRHTQIADIVTFQDCDQWTTDRHDRTIPSDHGGYIALHLLEPSLDSTVG